MVRSTTTTISLTRSRLGLAIVSTAAALGAGYLLYRIWQDHIIFLGQSRRLRRSNAVRRRRQDNSQDPQNRQALAEGQADGTAQGHSDEASTTGASHGDENENAEYTARPLADGETVAEEHAMDDDWWNDPPDSAGHQRAGQNIVGLLFRVSEDNARRNAYVHRGCQCNSCGAHPIRGIRYRCAHCADFDLCETCESQGIHIKTHIFYKVKVPAPPFAPRHTQPAWYPGDPDTCLRSLPRATINKLSRETGFERPELEAFWEQWTFMANTEWRDDPDELYLAMDRKTFGRCLVPSGPHQRTSPNLIHDRMFAFYDTNKDDLIGFREFLLGVAYRKHKNKLRKVFEGYDMDGDGLVNRRDFLRLFRAYYVLYKQMHREILEGLDGQVLSSIESRQLVASRQPLSGSFGREGRIPRANGERHLENKTGLGDDCPASGRTRSGVSVVVQDKPDTAERETILHNLFGTDSCETGRLATSSPDSTENPNFCSDAEVRHLQGLIHPPNEVDDLPAFLSGVLRETGALDVLDFDNFMMEPSRRSSDGANSESRPTETRPLEAFEFEFDHFLEESIGRLSVSANRESRPTEPRNRLGLLSQAANRVPVRRRLLQRWQRRQFYLDEEEGASAPQGWTEDEDILNRFNGAKEEGKKCTALPPRSRSSSKVRFAEDMDECENRSNPSTSSRSVPERWGGMEIPNAERDTGKEILYQVTQQAFNELLDKLFKDKEELAVRVAQTKDVRDQYRHLFKEIDVGAETWERDKKTLDRMRRKLAELERCNSERLRHKREAENAEAGSRTLVGIMPGVEETALGQDAARESEIWENSLPEDESTRRDTVETPEQRDPTMPQFRPNSVVPSQRKNDVGLDDEASALNQPAANTDEPNTPAISHEELVEFKRLDLAEEESLRRGGWGRLTYDEFEAIYKREEETRSGRLDYLGSWIDFCIP